MSAQHEELRKLLFFRTRAMMDIAAERDALKLALGRQIGSGVKIEEWEVVLVHRPCGELGDPAHHVCPGVFK